MQFLQKLFEFGLVNLDHLVFFGDVLKRQAKFIDLSLVFCLHLLGLILEHLVSSVNLLDLHESFLVFQLGVLSRYDRATFLTHSNQLWL